MLMLMLILVFQQLFNFFKPFCSIAMEQNSLNVNNCLNTNNIFSYLETYGGQSYLYLNVTHFFNTSVN
jgi:hypothetical protein